MRKICFCSPWQRHIDLGRVAQHHERAWVDTPKASRLPVVRGKDSAGIDRETWADGVIGSRGGIPLVEDGKLIGAIGASGGTGSQDEVSSKVGAALINK